MVIHPVVGPEIPMLLLMLVFMAMIAFFFLRDPSGAWRELKASRSWPTAEGKILSAKLVDSSTSSADDLVFTRYRPEVVYQFRVNGKQHEGTRLCFGTPDDWRSRKQADAVLARFPVGAPVPVYYDPETPLLATLSRTAPAVARKRAIGFALLAAHALIMLVVLWVLATRTPRDEASSRAPRGSAARASASYVGSRT